MRTEPHNPEDATRAAEIVAALSAGHSSAEEVFAAFEELDGLDPEAVRAALGTWTGPAPDFETLDDATRKAHGFAPRALKLQRITLVRDADVLDLGPTAEQQIRIAGRLWDGRDLAPEDRLDGEDDDSFAGTLEHHTLAAANVDGDGAKTPQYDVLLYAGDAGTVFRAGTAEVVGGIAYGKVEMNDRRARAAIEEALAAPFIEPEIPTVEEIVDDEPEDEPEDEEEVNAAENATVDAEVDAEDAEENAAVDVEENAEVDAEEEAPPQKKKKKTTTTAAAKKKTAAAPKKKTATAKKAGAAKKKTTAAAPKKKTATATKPKKTSAKKKTATTTATAKKKAAAKK